MKLEKQKRYEHAEHLKFIRTLPCFICGKRPSDPDHVKTVGSGGPDSLSNLNALCRNHHTERHAMGIKSFWAKYSDKIIKARKLHNLPPVHAYWLEYDS